MMTKIERPAIVTDEHLLFLDDLRESGVTNMFGCSPYIQDEFSVSRADAKTIAIYWMQSFGERHPR
jgi:hypothetical protein